MDRGFDEKEAARRLGVSVQTLRNWRSMGRGPAYYKFGRAVRYADKDIAAYVAEHRIETARDPTERG